MVEIYNETIQDLLSDTGKCINLLLDINKCNPMHNLQYPDVCTNAFFIFSGDP